VTSGGESAGVESNSPDDSCVVEEEEEVVEVPSKVILSVYHNQCIGRVLTR